METIREYIRNLGEEQEYNEGCGKIDTIPLYYISFENITVELIAHYKYNTLIKL